MAEPLGRSEPRTRRSARPPDIGQHPGPLRAEENEWLPLDVAESVSGPDPWIREENRELLEMYLATRSDADQAILNALIFEGKPPSDVATELRKSKRHVEDVYQRATSALRVWFEYDSWVPEDFT